MPLEFGALIRWYCLDKEIDYPPENFDRNYECQVLDEIKKMYDELLNLYHMRNSYEPCIPEYTFGALYQYDSHCSLSSEDFQTFLQSETSFNFRQCMTINRRCIRKPRNSKSNRMVISKESKDILLAWLIRNINDPYPSSEERSILALKTKMSLQQIKYWFINVRRRKLKKYKKENN